ncbi:MAG: hypothetical protein IJ568_08090 [Bacilli bacterium]|nr:hypothetical protein [Bacilli bacterium]
MNEKIELIFSKYNLDDDERKELLAIINPIICHDEFKRRTTSEFLHHSDITLGEHIIEDAVETYKLCKKKNKKKAKVNTRLAVIISMFHDLYTNPWQNNKSNKVKKFSNKHGFRHPLEAVINAYNWYPDFFQNDKEAVIIIDGIIHHMYPLPVSRFKTDNKNELKNYELVNNLNKNIKDMIYLSSNRNKLFNFSFSKSKYLEGRIMAKADKKVSLKQIKNVSSGLSLITGKNKKIK